MALLDSRRQKGECGSVTAKSISGREYLKAETGWGSAAYVTRSSELQVKAGSECSQRQGDLTRAQQYSSRVEN
jgi:hypothetical protein